MLILKGRTVCTTDGHEYKKPSLRGLIVRRGKSIRNRKRCRYNETHSPPEKQKEVKYQIQKMKCLRALQRNFNVKFLF